MKLSTDEQLILMATVIDSPVRAASTYTVWRLLSRLSPISMGTVHVAAHGLEEKGLLTCALGEASEERGWRRRLNLALTAEGQKLFVQETVK